MLWYGNSFKHKVYCFIYYDLPAVTNDTTFHFIIMKTNFRVEGNFRMNMPQQALLQ